MEFVDILRAASDHDASDIHMVAGRPLSMRVKGRIVAPDRTLLSRQFVRTALDSVASSDAFRAIERRGDASFAFEHPGLGRFRVWAQRQRGSLSLSIRPIVSRGDALSDIFAPEALDAALSSRDGVILIVGGCGAGRTTTVATIVRTINGRDEKRVLSIEDPIEHVIVSDRSVIEQREVGRDVASGAHALLGGARADYDVIACGDLSAGLSVSQAITLAGAGRLVVATSCAPSITRALDQLILTLPSDEREDARHNLADALRLIVRQALLPRADGSGMVAAFETLLVNDDVRALIAHRNAGAIGKLLAAPRTPGVCGMRHAVSQRFTDGLISHDDAVAYAGEEAVDARRRAA